MADNEAIQRIYNFFMFLGSDQILNVVKVFGLASLSFLVALLWTPFLSRFLYHYKMWRKSARNMAADGSGTPIFHELHKDREVNVPRMGGLLIWVTATFLALFFYALARYSDSAFFDKLNFLSRNQTWLPFVMMIAASLLGLVDDLFQIYEKGTYRGGGLGLARRIFFIILIASAGAYWFYFRLGWETIYIPGFGNIYIGGLYIPLFILTTLATFSGGIIDGLDGLAGGVFAAMFGAYAAIAFFNNQIDLAAFAGVILGGLLAFLWFNIPPARFYMGETGMMGLTVALTVLAFMTDSVLVLPLIGILLVVEVVSDIIQFASKRFRGKKVFLVAPLHHHFEAKGLPAHSITMRFWIIGVIAAIIGTVVALIGR